MSVISDRNCRTNHHFARVHFGLSGTSLGVNGRCGDGGADRVAAQCRSVKLESSTVIQMHCYTSRPRAPATHLLTILFFFFIFPFLALLSPVCVWEAAKSGRGGIPKLSYFLLNLPRASPLHVAWIGNGNGATRGSGSLAVILLTAVFAHLRHDTFSESLRGRGREGRGEGSRQWNVASLCSFAYRHFRSGGGNYCSSCRWH